MSYRHSMGLSSHPKFVETISLQQIHKLATNWNMKGSIAFVLGVVGLVAIFGLARGAEEMTCKEFVGGLTKRQLGGIQECSKKLNLKTGKEKKEKMACVLKCVMMKEKLLNQEGLFDDENFDAFLARELPPSLLEKGGGLFRGCKDTTGKLLDAKEEYCKTYDVLIKCFLGICQFINY